ERMTIRGNKWKRTSMNTVRLTLLIPCVPIAWGGFFLTSTTASMGRWSRSDASAVRILFHDQGPCCVDPVDGELLRDEGSHFPESNRYPSPLMVTIISGETGSFSSFRLRLAI